MQEAAELTLQEAAELLGVHYMTAYRYVRLGQLAATKQAGTWRVTPAAIAELRRAAEDGEPADRGGRRRAPWAERLESRLLAGDSRGSWGVVESALAAGLDPSEVYLEVLAPALAAIGDRWARGEVDVALEHRASGLAMRLIGRLGPRFVRPGRTRGVVIVGAPAGERHGLPVAMLSDLVRRHGWEVSDLGADVPDGSFVHAVTTTPDLVAVGVSITTPDSVPAARQACAAIRAAAPGLLLVVGGAGALEATAAELGVDAVSHDGAGFAALLDGVHGMAPSG